MVESLRDRFGESKKQRAPVAGSLGALIRALEKGVPPTWNELEFGLRGTDFSKVCFRDMNIGTGPEGGFLAASKQPTNAIEFLGAILLAARAGALSIAADAADFSPMPKETTPPTLYWVEDGIAPPDDSDGAWGSVNPSLRTGVVWSDLTRLLSVITGGAADRILTKAFFRSVARGVDRAVFHGTGGAEPLGIVNVPNVGTVDGTTFSLLKACSMLKAVEDGNAAAITWCMAPDVAELLRQRPKATSGERMIFEDGKILDKPALVSTGISAGHLFCGDFSNVTVLNRSLELLVNRSTESIAGATRLLVFWMGDVIVTTPQAFCVSEAVS